MGLFDIFRKKTLKEHALDDGEELYDEEDCEGCDETLSVYDAALIWASHGKDEDYMFGYTEEELEDAL